MNFKKKCSLAKEKKKVCASSGSHFVHTAAWGMVQLVQVSREKNAPTTLMGWLSILSQRHPLLVRSVSDFLTSWPSANVGFPVREVRDKCEFAIQYGCPLYQRWVIHFYWPLGLFSVFIMKSHRQFCATSTCTHVVFVLLRCQQSHSMLLYGGVWGDSANGNNRRIHPAFPTSECIVADRHHSWLRIPTE